MASSRAKFSPLQALKLPQWSPNGFENATDKKLFWRTKEPICILREVDREMRFPPMSPRSLTASFSPMSTILFRRLLIPILLRQLQ